MASSSSSQAVSQDNTPLALIPCPKCGNRVLTKVAVSGTRPGVRYYKCSLFSAGLCTFFEWREGYAGLLAAAGGFQAAGVATGQVAGANAGQAINNQEVARINLFVSLANTVGVMLVMGLILAQIMLSTYK